MLYQLANREGGFRPAKYFSIDRVFRNETMVFTGVPLFLLASAAFGLDRVDGVMVARGHDAVVPLASTPSARRGGGGGPRRRR